MPDVCEVKKYQPNKMYFWQILLKIEKAAILRGMGTKASNFQVSSHFTIGFKNGYW